METSSEVAVGTQSIPLGGHLAAGHLETRFGMLH